MPVNGCFQMHESIQIMCGAMHAFLCDFFTLDFYVTSVSISSFASNHQKLFLSNNRRSPTLSNF